MYTTSDVARMLGVKRRTFYYWVKHGTVPVPTARKGPKGGEKVWTMVDVQAVANAKGLEVNVDG